MTSKPHAHLMSTPEAWFKAMPPVTRAYFVVSVVTTILVSFSILSPYYLYLDWDLVIHKFQIWRLLTNFFFFGKFSMPFIFQVYMMTKYFPLLENGYFANGARGTAEFATLVAFGVLTMDIISFFWAGLQFMGPALIFMVLYIWSRKSPYDQISFFGFLFQQWHLPFVMLVFAILIGSNPVLDCLGIFVGHIYHFVVDIVPAAYGVGPYIKTPQFVYNYFEGRPVAGGAQMPRGAGYRLNQE